MINRVFRRTILFGCLTFIVGCSQIPMTYTVTPTFQSIMQEDSTTPSATATAEATKTSTPMPLMKLDLYGLPVQQYAIFTEERFLENSIDSPTDFYVNIISLDGKYQRTLFHDTSAIGEIPNEVLLSSDQKHLIIFDNYLKPNNASAYPMMINLETGELESVSEILSGCIHLSFDAIGQKWLGECGNSPEIMFRQPNNPPIYLTNCYKAGDECRSPQWSPDGKWISFLRGQIGRGGGTTMNYGIQLISADCAQQGAGCTLKYQLSGGLENYVWSPDSRFIAAASFSYDPIVIYEINSGKLVQYKKMNLNPHQFPGSTLVWSSDGKYLAYDDSSYIYLLNISSEIERTIVKRDDAIIGLVRVTLVGLGETY